MNCKTFALNLISILLCLSLAKKQAEAQPAIGNWQTHFPYQNAFSLAIQGDKIYCATNVTLFSLDLSDGAVERFDKLSGLSETNVSVVQGNESDQSLIIGYDNGMVDILKKDVFYALPDIRQKLMTGDKKIYHIFPWQNQIYLSTGFGVVVVDPDKLEISATYVIGEGGGQIPVYSMAILNDTIFAATAEGIKDAPRTGLNLLNFQSWKRHTPADNNLSENEVRYVAVFNDQLFCGKEDSLFKYQSGTWTLESVFPGFEINNLTAEKNKMTVSLRNENDNQGKVVVISQTGHTERTSSGFSYPMQAIETNDGILWVADLFRGLTKVTGSSSESIVPNGPSSIDSYRLASAKGETWVVAGGINAAWNTTFNYNGAYRFSERWWNNYNLFTHPIFDTMISLIAVAVHPFENRVFLGSFLEGIVEWDNGVFKAWNSKNSTLQGPTSDPLRTFVSGLAFDAQGNLWVSNHAATKPLSVYKTDGTWKSFQPTVSASGINQTGSILVDDFNQKWVLLPRAFNDGILVFNHGFDIDDLTDDKWKTLKTGTGQGGLPSNSVLSLAKDRNGEIWAGTDLGIAVFYCPGSVFSDFGCDAQQIFVVQEGVNAYLLESERVNAIAVDMGNRKWVGTDNGAWLFSPDGIEQLAYFTTDNSPLPSNVINDIAIDHLTGEVFFATEKGLVSYRGEALAGAETHTDVLVYPNPVKGNYEGPIAIKGLADRAEVKITDAAGNLVFQTIALGGQAIWDGKRQTGERAVSGVYLVYSASADGKERFAGKFLIIR